MSDYGVDKKDMIEMADVIATAAIIQKEELAEATKDIASGKDAAEAALERLRSARARQISWFEEIEGRIISSQGSSNELEAVRSLRDQAIEDWNILSVNNNNAKEALEGFLAKNSDSLARIPSGVFLNVAGKLGKTIDVMQFLAALSTGDEGEVLKTSTSIFLGYIAEVAGKWAIRAAAASIAVTVGMPEALVGFSIMVVILAFSQIGVEIVPDETWDEWVAKGREWMGFDSHAQEGSVERKNFLFGTSDGDVRSGIDGVDFIFGGGGADIIYGNSGDDYIDGGFENDSLYGDQGSDVINGGAGDDVLTGGTKGDQLNGGVGFDIYNFSVSDFDNSKPVDTIIDSDGLGKITFNGLDISGTGIGFDNIRHASLDDWETSDGSFRLVVSGEGGAQSLLIIHKQTLSRIVVKNWQNGQLGITLPGVSELPAGGAPLSGGDDLFGVYGSNHGDDGISGLAGNDGIEGGAGDDSLDAGAGDDLVFGGAGNDRIYGGDGNDFIHDGSELSSMRALRTTIDADGKSEQQRFDEEIARRGASVVAKGKSWFAYREDGTAATGNATQEGDVVIWLPDLAYLDPNVSPSGNDLIDAGAGSDKVFAGEGDDVVVGGTGDDYLNGGHDHDIINGGEGNDEIDGDIGDENEPYVYLTALVSAAAVKDGNDILDGGAGNDEVRGGGGNDVIYGGSGNDTLLGRSETRAVDADDADADYIDGGDGNDQITGDDGDDTLLGGAGADIIRGDQETELTISGNDTIDGGGDDDILFGDGGNDTVLGGAGADQIQGDTTELAGDKHGNDILSGGAGNDIIGGQGGDDIVMGDDGDDQLGGDAAESQLALAYHGNDQLFGGKGNDLLWGGGGTDTLGGGEGDDQLDGEQGNDTLSGGEGKDHLFGGVGNDALSGDADDDILSGGEGDDSLSGGSGIDVLDAGAGNDTLEGGSGNDTLDGDEGEDVLSGGDGNDALYGGTGNDRLVGGTGNDGLAGAQGNDVYVFNAGWGMDSIQGLAAADAGRDTIVFGSGIGPEDLAVSATASGDVMLGLAGGSDRLLMRGLLTNADAGHSVVFADGTVWSLASILAKLAPSQPGEYSGDSTGNVIVAGPTVNGTRLTGGYGNDLLIGGDGDDKIYGGLYSDANAHGAPDNDLIFGGAGNDYILAADGDDFVDGGAGNDTINGGYGADRLYGGAGNDVIDAGWWDWYSGLALYEASNDLVVGGEGDDKMQAGLGTNTYYFAPGFGHDKITLTQASQYEIDTLGRGSEHAVLEFGAGITAADVQLIRSGNDLQVQHGSDYITILEFGSRGSSIVEFVFDDGSVLSAQQLGVMGQWPGTPVAETLSGGGGDDLLEGLESDDSLYANDGNDILVGGQGKDRLQGDAGDDTYRYGLQDGVDTIQGSALGMDTLELGPGIGRSDVTFHIEAAYGGFENLYVVIETTGNYIQAAWATGQADQALDLIRFADGTTMTAAEVQLAAVPMTIQLAYKNQPGSTSLAANGYANKIYGGSNDWSTTLAGGKGDDTYYLRSNFQENGTPIENANEGNDTVVTDQYGYWLPDNIENLVAEWNDTTYWYGREFVGNALDNIIDASRAGGTQAFRLDGGAGADILIGSGSRDTYVVDNQSDRIFEPTRSDSVDAVESSISYSIADQPLLENIKLVGGADISATGNAKDNILTGNAGANTLIGGGGNDTLTGGEGSDTLAGGAGNDTFVVDANDTISELAGEGTDTAIFDFYPNAQASVVLAANVENGVLADRINLLEMYGNSGNNMLTGNKYGNTLHGLDGNDTLMAGIATSQLYGDGGDDTLTGSALGWDVLDGGAGADTMRGLGGNDTYFVDSAGDVVIEEMNGGDGDKVVSSLGSYTMEENIELVELAVGAVAAIGRQLDDRMYGNEIGNVLSGLDGNDQIEGRGGNDQLSGGSGNDQLDGGGGNDVLAGGDGNDRLLGGTGDDTLDGGDGDDRLEGGDGDDALRGGAGSDYLFANSGNNLLSGGSGNDTLLADVGNDVLEGGQGADQLWGEGGADTYLYNSGDGSDSIYDSGGNDPSGVRDVLEFGSGIGASDVVVKRSARDGNAWVEIGGEIIALYGVEDIRFADGTVWDVQAVAQLANDPPQANGQPDQPVFVGKAFSWTLPDDAFYDEEALTYSVIEMPGWLAYDTATRTFGGTLPTNPDGGYSLTVRATDPAGQWSDLTINMPVLTAITGTSAADTLTGTNAPEGIFGLGGNDTLNGLGGNDYLYGGTGDDTYLLDGGGDDTIVEAAGEGTDAVSSAVSYMLAANVENLTLTGTQSNWGEGNGLANTITGNNGANQLYGNAGDDALVGNEGNDTLEGGEGNDTLNGGSGSDEMRGGEGDDTYLVDSSDQIVESENEGVDTVKSSVSWTLGGNVENLTLTGSTAINGTGNALDNVLTGNGAANTLNGGAGNDTLDGGAGNDTMVGGLGDDSYVVGATGDVVTESANAGVDTVNAAIAYTLGSTLENLTLTGTAALNGTGNAANNVIAGNSGNNVLSALAGNDTLEGKGGTDTLTGGTGNDTYLMARAYGSDTVDENDATAGNTDVARFLAGVAYDQLWFKRPASSNHLEISIIGTTDKLVIKNWYLGAQYRVEEIRTVDGNKVLYAADVQALVNAMAGMTPPAQGQTTLSASQRTALAPVFASSWHDQPAAMQVSSGSLPATLAADGDVPGSTRTARVPSMAGGSRPDEDAAGDDRVALLPGDAGNAGMAPALAGGLRPDERIVAEGSSPLLPGHRAAPSMAGGSRPDAQVVRHRGARLVPAEAWGTEDVAPAWLAQGPGSASSLLAWEAMPLTRVFLPDAFDERKETPAMGARHGPDAAGIPSFDGGGCDLYDMVVANGFGETAVACGLYDSAPATPVSDCHSLIEMMAITDRSGPEALVTFHQQGRHLDHALA